MIGKDSAENSAIPFHDFDSAFRCLGVLPSSPKVETMDGYIRMSYDMIVKPASNSCLFS